LKFGKTDINILMLSVCYKGVAIPIIWMLLPKRGNSNYKERKELIDQYIKLFGTSSIASLISDREFIGGCWFKELIHERIPFYIIIKGNMKVYIPKKGEVKVFWLFNKQEHYIPKHYKGLVYIDQNLVYLSGLKMLDPQTNKYEYLISLIPISTVAFF